MMLWGCCSSVCLCASKLTDLVCVRSVTATVQLDVFRSLQVIDVKCPPRLLQLKMQYLAIGDVEGPLRVEVWFQLSLDLAVSCLVLWH